MAEPYLGEIRIFSFGFPPKGWALCNGAILQITQMPALYALLRSTYGGDGRITFALPDLRGRVPLHPGTGYPQGSSGGVERVQLSLDQLPSHSHTVKGTSEDGKKYGASETSSFAKCNDSHEPVYLPVIDKVTHTAHTLVDMAPGVIGTFEGDSKYHNNVQPILAVNFSIALQGTFPQRS